MNISDTTKKSLLTFAKTVFSAFIVLLSSIVGSKIGSPEAFAVGSAVATGVIFA